MYILYTIHGYSVYNIVRGACRVFHIKSHSKSDKTDLHGTIPTRHIILYSYQNLYTTTTRVFNHYNIILYALQHYYYYYQFRIRNDSSTSFYYIFKCTQNTLFIYYLTIRYTSLAQND